MVRTLIGDGRSRRAAALAQRNRVSEWLRIGTDCWQPSLTLIAKQRDKTTGQPRQPYDAAQTPYRRLLASGVLDDSQPPALAATFAAGGPLARRPQSAPAVEQLGRLQERANERF